MEFQIYLLTPQTRRNSVYYTKDLMTDFVSQTTQQPHYSYTYDETYKESENSKKSLTFMMTKRVFLNGDWVENPFVAAAQPNSQLLLVDRYGNETIFVITEISYSFSSINVTYSYTCEDFFSYSTTRQNDGYVIENNSESDEFIGSRTLDWWAYKIRKDCNIRYEYIPMREAVYVDRNGAIHHSLDIENCKRLIKNAYDEANFKDYYTQTIFSCSGSSANAALVDLTDRLDMHVRVYEHLVDTNNGSQLVGYFWFEPKKNDLRDSGLVYSPNTSIQSFGLTHSSKSLTSILNVQGPTYNDELITLIPDITPFFFRYFESKMWLKSDFKENGFTALLQRQTFTGQKYENRPTRINDETDGALKERIKQWYAGIANVAVNSKTIYYHDIEVENGVITIPLDRLDLFITYSGLYPHISFKGSLIGASNQVYTPQNSKWTLVRSYPNNPVLKDKPREFIEGSILPTEKTSEKCEHKLVIDCGEGYPGTSADYLSITLNLSLYDNFTTEDRAFAKAADKCPWLENKIIDLSYFKKAGIISSAEYRDLLNLLYNKLRIINGRLLCYSKAYYTALHNKTQILAEITNDFDSLGAACQAAIVTPYETKGTVKDITYFNSAYNHAFIATEARPGLMFQISETLSSFFTKYFNAQQRFLKNIYTFRKFWEAPVSIAGDGIYTNTFTLDRPDSWNTTPESDTTETYFSFSSTSTAAKAVNTTFTQYNSNKDSAQYGAPLFPIYKQISTANGTNDYQYLRAAIASRDTCSKYKRRIDPEPDDLTEVVNNHYNPEKTYYKKVLTVDFPAIIQDTAKGYKYSISLTSTNESSIVPTDNTTYTGLWLATNLPLTTSQLEGTVPVAANTLFICGIYDIKSVDSSTKQYTFEMQKQLAYGDGINDAMFEAANLLLVPVYLDANGNAYFVKGAQPIYNIMNGIDLTEGVEASKKKVMVQKQTLVNLLNNFCMVHYEGLKDLYSITSPDIYTDIPTLRKCLDPYYQDTNGKWQYKDNDGLTIRRILNSAFFDKIADESFKQRLPLPYDNYSYQANFPSTEFYWNGYRSTFNYNTGEYTFYKKNGVSTKDWNELKPEDKQNLPVYFVTKNNVDQFYHVNNSFNALSMTGWFVQQDAGNKTQYLTAYMEWVNNTDALGWTNDAAAPCDIDIFGNQIAMFNNYADTSCEIKRGKIDDPSPSKFTVPYRYSPLSQGPVAGTISKYLKQYRYEQKAYADIISERGYTFSTLFEQWSAGERGASGSLGLQVQDDFKFKDSYWIRADEVVQDGEYGLLEIPENTTSDNILWEKACNLIESDMLFETFNGEQSSALIYYPLTQKIRSVNFSGLDWKHNDIFTVEQALKTVFNGTVSFVPDKDKQRMLYIDITCFGRTRRFIFLRHWTFNLVPLTLTAQDNIQCRALKTSIIYDNETKRKVNWEQEPYSAICDNFYEAAAPQYEDVTPENFSLDYIYWNTETDTQVPTITQAGKLGGYVYYDFFSYSEESFINHVPSISLVLYKHQRDIRVSTDKKNVSIKDTVLDSGTTLQLDLAWNTDTFEMPILVGEQKLNLHVQQQTTAQNFKDLTNGTFWYNYKDDTAHTLCLSHAAAIEAELTQYWNAAYVASKYCEYYLPENWVEFVNKKNNYTFKRIFSVGDQIEISNDLVPIVHIVTDENGETELPNYTWTYESQSLKKHAYPQDEWLQTERKNGAEIAANNPALINAFAILNETPSNYYGEESGKTTYYYTDEVSGGKTWPQLIYDLTHKDYSQYSGIYVLTYRAIRQGYLDTNIEAYDQAKRDQQQMWRYLYDHYSNVLFEKSYTNSDATTSEELYNAAMNELLDTTIPERSYNMSIIDWHSLKGYDGHELRIGDPIKINADELYSDKDFVYQSLSQLLFISDISYTLRDPSSLSVTVNNVKYSDKLISRLVSLIH